MLSPSELQQKSIRIPTKPMHNPIHQPGSPVQTTFRLRRTGSGCWCQSQLTHTATQQQPASRQTRRSTSTEGQAHQQPDRPPASASPGIHAEKKPKKQHHIQELPTRNQSHAKSRTLASKQLPPQPGLQNGISALCRECRSPSAGLEQPWYRPCAAHQGHTSQQPQAQIHHKAETWQIRGRDRDTDRRARGARVLQKPCISFRNMQSCRICQDPTRLMQNLPEIQPNPMQNPPETSPRQSRIHAEHLRKPTKFYADSNRNQHCPMQNPCRPHQKPNQIHAESSRN